MTKQEAIEILDWIPTKGDEVDAMEMAIEALRFADEYHKRTLEAYAHDMGVSLKQAERELRVDELSCSEKPNNSDLISRQDAIDVAKQHWYKPDIAKALEELPSAQEEIIRCKDCKNFEECDKVMFWYGEDDFCSRAERKDNG